MALHENKEQDKKIDEAIKIATQVIKGLYEKDRLILESAVVTNFIEKNFGVIGKQYYDAIKENYLR
jgi:hypothetical protein